MPPIVSLLLAGSVPLLTLSPLWGNGYQAFKADQSQAGNPPEHAFDADPDTRWAAPGRGRWIQCELEKAIEFSAVKVGFARSERDYAFDIRTSLDGKSWTEPVAHQSERKAGVIDYAVPTTVARFVRVTVHGSDANHWANVHTIALADIEPLPSSSPRIVSSGDNVVSEWATGGGVVNGVGLDFDDRGRAFVTTVQRRKQSSLDIRHHKDLVKTDLSFETVEDRRAFYHSYLTGKSWLPDRNDDGQRDWRDLTVQKDTLTRVTDTNDDGVGDQVEVLDEYHSEVTGIAAGVLAVEDDIFVAVEPDFLRYPDGKTSAKEVVATGLQVHIGQGGHNLSGVAIGPDGRVYWSLADKGHDVKTKEGRIYHRPNSGAIFRCELDGTNVERYSTGQRNAQELAFDSHGNLFSMDNDGDYPGEKERALYITEGSEHGWRLNWQWLRLQDFIKISGLPAYNPWMDERLFLPNHEAHAAYLTPTIGNFGPGPCGFTNNPGTALSEDLADAFFMTNQQGQVRILAFHPKEASFTFEELAPMKGGVNNTGLAIGPDGALYAASYGNERGAIYRFDVPPEKRHPLREETRAILARSSKECGAEELSGWLDHADQRVRMKGQFELARRELFGQFNLALFNHDTSALGRLHAVWGLGQIARRQPALSIFLLGVVTRPDEHDPELLAQSAKVLGDLPSDCREAEIFRPWLRKLLDHPAPRVAFFAAISLGKLRDDQAGPALVRLLETRGSADPYLRHAAVMGLSGGLPPIELAALSTHGSRTVRLGAIVALRWQAAPEIRAFLKDTDELVLLEAARAIHDDQSIPEALPELAALLDRSDLQSEALMRRVINAAFRDGSDGSLQRLGKYLKRGHGSPKLNRTALASILWWTQPPVLDPVEGRYREHAARPSEPVDEAVRGLKETILADRDLLEVLLNGVIERSQAPWLAGVVYQPDNWPPALQCRYLSALAKTKSPQLKAVVKLAIESPHADVRETARRYAPQAGVPSLDLLFAVLDDPQSGGQGKAVIELAKLDDPRAQARLTELISQYRQGKAEPAWKLELWQAAKSIGADLPETPDRLEHGGDPKRGRKLVREHAAAQCLRCHRIGKEGGDATAVSIGPDLTTIGDERSREHLVESLLEPARSISDGYGTVVLTTKDRQEVAGILTRKSEEVWTITLADGSTQKINSDNIAGHTLTSVMPPIGALMTSGEIRDIVSYLASLGK